MSRPTVDQASKQNIQDSEFGKLVVRWRERDKYLKKSRELGNTRDFDETYRSWYFAPPGLCIMFPLVFFKLVFLVSNWCALNFRKEKLLWIVCPSCLLLGSYYKYGTYKC